MFKNVLVYSSQYFNYFSFKCHLYEEEIQLPNMCYLLGAIKRMLTDSMVEIKPIHIITDPWPVLGTFANKLYNVATPQKRFLEHYLPS